MTEKELSEKVARAEELYGSMIDEFITGMGKSVLSIDPVLDDVCRMMLCLFASWQHDRQHELLGITPEDYKFLKELQHELNTQDSDGQADPVYWSVMETRPMPAAEGCGEEFVYMSDGMLMTPQEVVTFVQENGYLGDLDDRQKTQWEELNKDDARELVDFLHEAFEWYDARVVYLEQQEGISHETGAFLTKRACKEYIKRFGYNHSQPRTYAMTAYRNRELAEFLRIFRSIKL